MKLKYLQTILLITLLALPVKAQVYLDSAEIAHILHKEDPKAIIVDKEEDSDSDEDSDVFVTPFDNDNTKSWQENITARLNGILKSDIVETTQVGLMVWDLTDNKQVYAFNERKHLRPASTMKCVTAITALDRLGCNYNYQTRIFYTGTIDSTQVLNGDIYCVGGMDPMLSNSDLSAIAHAIKDLGVERINGNLYADLSFKDRDDFGKGWCWDDKNPRLIPLSMGRKDCFMGVLRTELRRIGVEHNGVMSEKIVPNNATLITTRTHSIGEVMHRMMKKSDNFYAESMFYQLAAANNGKWNGAKQARNEVNSLIRKIGLSPSNYNIADGSGLSLYNYVSAELELQLLRYAFSKADIYKTLYNTLPIAGVDGTLRKRMRHTPAANNVRAKTGTVMGVSSLAGYLTASNGHRLCFAIIVNGGMSQSPMRNLQNKICVALSQ